MTAFLVMCVIILALLAAPTVMALAFALYDRWLLRQLPPQLRALARHADGVCKRSSCPYPHDVIGDPL